MKFTAEYDDEGAQWVVVQWGAPMRNGSRSGNTVERCDSEAQANEIVDVYMTAMI